jgi:hypothetical protein
MMTEQVRGASRGHSFRSGYGSSSGGEQDLADDAARFGHPVCLRGLGQRENRVHDRLDPAVAEHWPEPGDDVGAQGALASLFDRTTLALNSYRIGDTGPGQHPGR